MVVFVDINRLGQSQPTMLEHDTKSYEKRFASFGWLTMEIDGHNLAQVVKAFIKAKSQDKKPVAILARTHKGKYFG